MPDTLTYQFPFLPMEDTTPAPEENPWAMDQVDSIFQAFADAPLVHRKSLFKQHHLQAENMPHTRHENAVPDWIFLAVLLMAGLVCLMVNVSRLKMTQVLESMVNGRSLNRLVRDNVSKRFRMLVPMSLIYVASIALLGYSFVSRSDAFGLEGLALFLLLLGVAVGYYFVRNGIILLLGAAFDDFGFTQLYVSNVYIYNMIGAIVLPPLLFLALYCPQVPALLYTCAGLVGLLFLIRLIRGLMLVLSNVKNSRFYIFYYLCTFEIVPLLVLSKLFLF